MVYRETRTVGLGGRLGSSMRGVLAGLMMLAGGTFLLWWNEGNFVATDQTLREARAATVELGDINRVDPSKNGRLVHAVGQAETGQTLTDSFSGLQAQAIRLEREVRYYQWVEHSSTETRTKIGGEEETVTTYTYDRQWTPRPVDSSAFKDPEAVRNKKNSTLARVEEARYQAGEVRFGAYRLPEFLIDAIGGAEPLRVELSQARAEELNRQLFPAAASSLVHTRDNTIILSTSPDSPQIGDLRLSFQVTRPATVSLLALCRDDSFEKYRSANGRDFSRLAMGARSQEEMYESAHSANSFITWILRLAGTVLVIIGLKALAGPLTVLASVVPPLGRLVGMSAGLVAVLTGLSWSFLVISVAWLRFRPVVGLALVAAAGGLIFLLYARGRARPADH